MPGPASFDVQELAPGVHAAVARAGGWALCNAAIVDLGDLTVVFDAMLTPQAGAELARATERLTGRRPDVLVQSHYHGDHIRGTAALAPVRIVSTRATRELIRDRGRAHLEGDRAEAAAALAEIRAGRYVRLPSERPVYEGWFEGVLATPEDLPFPLPDVTFEHALRLHGTRRAIEVLSYGGGHSPSDTFVHLPDEGMAFLGDLLAIGFHPYLTDGVPGRFEEIVGRIRRLRPRVTLPGHGPVGTGEDLERMEEYVRRVRRTAAEERARGTPGAVLRSAEPPEPYTQWSFSAQWGENLAFCATQDRGTGP